MTKNWESPLKPTDLTESRLVEAILDGTFPPNHNLPPERDLAQQLGVTRPTLREALQRLSRDGWLEIRQGKPTRVRDYWREGNLLILNAIAVHQANLPKDFVPNLLQIRLLLAPSYTRLAMQNSFKESVRLLETLQQVQDSPEAFTNADLDLHCTLTRLSGNPVFTLILNGFGDLYRKMGLVYFQKQPNRDHSRSFYKKLLSAILSNDPFLVEEVTRRVMEDSINLWSQASKE